MLHCRCKTHKGEAKLFRPGVQPTEVKMQKTAPTILGALLITGLTAQMAMASEHHQRKAYRAPMTTGEQFRNANDSLALPARGFCSQESGNPYNERTDYESWSAFRESGAWDSRNDCP